MAVDGSLPTSARLLSTAAALFRAKGYAATTTRELSATLGIRNASLYHHIGKKEDLLYALCVDSLGHIRGAASQAMASEPDAISRLRALVRAHVVSALDDLDKHATMLIELRSLSPERRSKIVALRDEYEALVSSAIQDAQREGRIRADIPARHLTLALLNLLNWTIFWYQPGGDLTAEQLGELFARLFLHGAAAYS